MGTILVIDPNPELRTFVANILTRAGHTVKEAVDGPEAIAHLRLEPADLMVTDLMLPCRDCANSIGAIRREFPGLEIIALSEAPHAAGCLRLAATLGGRRTVANPFMNRQLMGLINEMVAGVAAYCAHVKYQSNRQAMAARN